MNQSELTEICRVLSETPEKIRLVAKNLTVEEQHFKPDKTQFSILEHICHLRDIEEQGYLVRIEKILGENNPFLPDLDGDKLAISREYQKKDLNLELDIFTRCRAESLLKVIKLSPPELEKVGEMEGLGEITLSKLLLKMFEHDEEHLQAILNLPANFSHLSSKDFFEFSK